nr:MAG TPA: tail tape measure [Caudoviricetes sp.]
MTVEELNVIVSANKDDFDRKIRQVNDNLVNVKKQSEDTSAGAMESFKSLASGLASLGIGDMVKQAISLAGDLQQNIGGSESVFKNYAGTIQKTAETAASSLGLSQSKYLATATKMGSLFQGSGFSVAQSADMVTQSMQRASDVASIMGISVDSAMEAVAGMAKGNFTMMDNLGVAINDTNLQIYAQEKGLGKLSTTQQKVNAAMQMFLDKSDYAAGNYAKENDTYSGALTTFKAELEDFAAEAGTALLPLVQSVLPVLSGAFNALKPVIMTVAEAVGGLGGIVADIQAKIEAATPAQQTMLKIAIGMAVAIPAVTMATRLMAAAKAAYSGVLAFLIPKQLTFASALKATMGWIGIIVGALALFGMATNKGTESVEDSSEKLKKENEAASDASEGVDDVAESTDNLTDSVKRSLAGFDELNRLSGNSGTLALSVVSSDDVENAEGLAEAMSNVQEQVGGTSLETSLGLNFDFDGLLDGLSGVLNKANEIITDLFGEEFVEFFKGVGEDIYNIFNGNETEQYNALVRLNDKFKSLFGDLGEGWSDFWQGIGEGIYKFANGDLLSGLEKINSMFEGLFGDLGKGWSNFWQSVGAGLYEMTHADELKEIDLSSKYGTSIGLAQLDSNEYMRSGYDPSEAWNMALEKNGLTSNEALYAVKQFSTYDPQKAYEELQKSGQINSPDTWGGLGLLALKKYADGGFPDYGDLFIANEAGPELVGTIGNRTAVANSSSIETAIYNAVRSAMSDSTGGQSADIHVTVDIDGDTVGETVARYNAVRNRRLNGRS